ncbi:MAG: tetratricopeptide repeat protein [Nitrospinaceae bacterium]|nr:tetratricopeptide repeat protein [Nitrospinaceae bacterium]NIT80654.1 tetratricopeptide repeat protein [Nitrospinaceae bacterium]NIY13678.1 tetratricopeptide repeat protein [Nitrospinaceae bacterium]
MNLSELQEQLESARQQGDVAGQTQALRALGRACQKNRQYQKAVQHHREALDVAARAGDRRQEAVAYGNLGCAWWEMAQLKKAVDHFRRAYELMEQTGDRSGQAAIVAILGVSFWRTCDWNEGLKYFRQALKLLETEQQSDRDPKQDERIRGLWEAIERGVALLEHRVRLGRDQKDPLKIMQPLFSLAALHLFTGQTDRLIACLNEVVPLAQDLGKVDVLDAAARLRGLALSAPKGLS